MIFTTVISSYLVYEISIVLPQVCKWYYRFDQRYKVFIDGYIDGAIEHKQNNPKIYIDPYIPPTLIFSQYRRDYLRRKDEL
jgi:hypothetical protein